jgi:hypothetical protein
MSKSIEQQLIEYRKGMMKQISSGAKTNLDHFQYTKKFGSFQKQVMELKKIIGDSSVTPTRDRNLNIAFINQVYQQYFDKPYKTVPNKFNKNMVGKYHKDEPDEPDEPEESFDIELDVPEPKSIKSLRASVAQFRQQTGKARYLKRGVGIEKTDRKKLEKELKDDTQQAKQLVVELNQQAKEGQMTEQQIAETKSLLKEQTALLKEKAKQIKDIDEYNKIENTFNQAQTTDEQKFALDELKTLIGTRSREDVPQEHVEILKNLFDKLSERPPPDQPDIPVEPDEPAKIPAIPIPRETTEYHYSSPDGVRYNYVGPGTNLIKRLNNIQPNQSRLSLGTFDPSNLNIPVDYLDYTALMHDCAYLSLNPTIRRDADQDMINELRLLTLESSGNDSVDRRRVETVEIAKNAIKLKKIFTFGGTEPTESELTRIKKIQDKANQWLLASGYKFARDQWKPQRIEPLSEGIIELLKTDLIGSIEDYESSEQQDATPEEKKQADEYESELESEAEDDLQQLIDQMNLIQLEDDPSAPPVPPAGPGGRPAPPVPPVPPFAPVPPVGPAPKPPDQPQINLVTDPSPAIDIPSASGLAVNYQPHDPEQAEQIQDLDEDDQYQVILTEFMLKGTDWDYRDELLHNESINNEKMNLVGSKQTVMKNEFSTDIYNMGYESLPAKKLDVNNRVNQTIKLYDTSINESFDSLAKGIDDVLPQSNLPVRSLDHREDNNNLFAPEHEYRGFSQSEVSANHKLFKNKHRSDSQLRMPTIRPKIKVI